MIEVSAASSKVVLTKLELVPPTPENKGTWVPSGAIRTAERSESSLKAALSWTGDVGDLNVPSKLGRSRSRSERRAGRGGGGDRLEGAVRREVLRTGRSGPTGPMIWSTWPGVTVATCMGRSNVTLSELTVPSRTRLSLPVPLGTEVDTT